MIPNLTILWQTAAMADATIYDVRHNPELNWESANLLTAFDFPWIDTPPPLTEFRALHDGERFHFRFDVKDDDLVLAESDDADERALGSDRVEIFIACDENLAPYYGFEMEPRGAILDYEARFHREFDYTWHLEDWITQGEVFEDGYRVTGSVGMETLRQLNCLQGKKMMTGVYRAEFSHDEDGETIQNWMSWLDPKTPKPDFHVPASFGAFVFE